jgi:hypothetical protein
LHFEEQIKLYRKQVIINLVKTTGAERQLGEMFQENILKVKDTLQTVHYVPFDVYKYCGHSKFQYLSILVNQIADDLKEMGYSQVRDKNGELSILRAQQGVFRTNCKDCLDRTNLVQGLIGKLSLLQQLKDLQFISEDETLEDKENQPFLRVVRETWSDNGDAISIQYAGTPALKRDVTRLGKRTLRGMLDDGISSGKG